MPDKTTEELEKVLKNTHISDAHQYLSENRAELIEEERCFSRYMKQICKRNNLLLQEVFLNADIPERYGYKLLSGEKHTKQRDIILRICYAARLSLEETQKALRIYGMPELYPRVPRDAVLMICFHERPGSVLDVNAYLNKNHMMPLRTSGTLEE